jgi:hypothetical protein
MDIRKIFEDNHILYVEDASSHQDGGVSIQVPLVCCTTTLSLPQNAPTAIVPR